MADEYVQVHPTMLSHRKVRKLARDLDLPLVVVRGHLVTLWINCLSHAEDGNLVDMEDEDIAHYAEWDDEASTFVAALLRHGWLDVVNNSKGLPRFEIHDWDDFTGRFRLAERRKHERERKATQRAKKKETLTIDDVPGTTESVPGTVPIQNGTVPESPALTEQNRTEHVVVVGGDESEKPVQNPAGLQAILEARLGVSSLPAKWGPVASALMPMTHAEVDRACTAARRQTPDARKVNPGLVIRIIEAARHGSPAPVARRHVSGVYDGPALKGLALHAAKTRWQELFSAPDIAWTVCDEQARRLNKLGMSDAELMALARDAIAAGGDTWSDFFACAEACIQQTR